MNNVQTAVVKLQKQKQEKVKKPSKEICKFVASVNNTMYNMSVEYYQETNTVKEFSVGFTLKEFLINNEIKPQPKTSALSSFSIFYNFINFGKYDLTSLEDTKTKKITIYKNVKNTFYGIGNTNTTKVQLKVSKVASIYLIIMNIYKQVLENEETLTILKNNKKQFPHDISLRDAVNTQIEFKKQLKMEFINLIKNTIKRWF